MSAVHSNHRHFNYFGPLLLLFIMLHLSTFFFFFWSVFFSWSSSSRRLPFSVETIFPEIPEKILTMVLDTLWNGFSPQTDVHTIETDPSAPENNGNICVLVSLQSSVPLFWDCFFHFARLIWTFVHWVPRSGFISILNGWCFTPVALRRRPLGFTNCKKTLRAWCGFDHSEMNWAFLTLTWLNVWLCSWIQNILFHGLHMMYCKNTKRVWCLKCPKAFKVEELLLRFLVIFHRQTNFNLMALLSLVLSWRQTCDIFPLFSKT